MKRILMYLRITTPTKTVQVAVPETLVDEEIARLTKCVPRTTAERAFSKWLLEWREKNERAVERD
jgi:hypothetical protein